MTITAIKRNADQTFASLNPFGALRVPEVYTFDSRSEAVCAVILEQYVQGWRVKRGVTWQVPLPFEKVADFKVGNTIIEYHPIDLKHEMRRSEFWKFKQKMAKIHPRYARDFEDNIKAEKCQAYTDARRELMNNSNDLYFCKLAVCCNDVSFANTVSKLTKHKVKAEVILEDWRECFQSL